MPPRRSSGSKQGRSKSSKGKKKRKKAGGAGWMKPVLIGVGAIAALSLMIGVGVVGIRMLGGGGVNNKINMAYLPPDSEMIVRLQVDEAWNTPLVQSLVTNPMVQPQLDKVQQETGIKPEDIESVVFGAAGVSDAAKQAQKQPGMAMSPLALAPDFSSMHGIAVIRTKVPINTGDLTGNGAETKTHQGQTYYLRALPDGTNVAMFLPDSQTMVTGTEADLKVAIEQGDKQQRRADLDFINEKHHILFVTIPKNPTSLTSKENGSLANLPSQLESLRGKLDGKILGSCIGITLTDGVEIELQGACQAAADAQTAQQEITKLIAEGKTQLAEASSKLPPAFAGILNVAKSLLEKTEVSASGTTFAINVTVSGSDIDTIKEQAGPMMMAAMMGL